MIDAPKAIRDYLLSKASLMAVVGTRIYAESDFPAAGYKPSDGPAIAFKLRGGTAETEQNVLVVPSVQFKCYGENRLEANRCYRALYDALNLGRGGTVRWAQAETLGQTLQEPETGWHFVLTFYVFAIANGGE